MRRIIVNSTPLIVLSNIGHLNLLKDLYGEIYIPQAVFDEVTQKNDSAKREICGNSAWIHVCQIQNETAKRMYQAKLHAGEVEVMILAQENPKADLLIIDDLAAKNTAKFLGLKVTGTLGIILKAKREHFIEKVEPMLNQMIADGFYITQKIYDWVKSEAGE